MMAIDKKKFSIDTVAAFCLLAAGLLISGSASAQGQPNRYSWVTDFSDANGIYAKILSTEVNRYSIHSPEFMVLWIMQDSGFRDSGLQIGDHIIGVEGQRFQSSKQYKIGTYDESRYWTDMGKQAGDAVRLLVRRDDDILTISGKLSSGVALARGKRGNEIYPGGPDRLADGEGLFPYPWSTWYAGLIGDMAVAMTGGANFGSYDSRKMYENLNTSKAQMAYLVQNHPCAWTENLLKEWKLARKAAKGKVYKLTEEDLAYRDIGQQRAEDVATAGKAAEKAFIEQRRQQLMDPFPLPSAFDVSRQEMAEKVVVLDDLVLGGDGIAVDAGQLYLVAGDASKGFYFIEVASREMGQVMNALYRYKRSVQYLKQEKYRIIGRIRQDPRMVNIRGQVTDGNLLQVLAASVSDAFFIDLTKTGSDKPMFVGEEELKAQRHPPDMDYSSPVIVMQVFIDALKYADEKTWKSLFRTWEIEEQQGGTRYLETDIREDRTTLHYSWEGSRKALLGLTNDHYHDVYDVRIGRVQSPYAVLGGEITEEEQNVNAVLGLDDDDEIDKGASRETGPLVEECEVELIRIGKFGNIYRSYVHTNSRKPRYWKLQRVDGGPWKKEYFSDLESSVDKLKGAVKTPAQKAEIESMKGPIKSAAGAKLKSAEDAYRKFVTDNKERFMSALSVSSAVVEELLEYSVRTKVQLSSKASDLDEKLKALNSDIQNIESKFEKLIDSEYLTPAEKRKYEEVLRKFVKAYKKLSASQLGKEIELVNKYHEKLLSELMR
jgi:hypothetical protein